MNVLLAQLLDPFIEPSDRLRVLCLVLLATLVTLLLYGGLQPQIQAVLLPPPWDKVMHAATYGVFAGLAWVAAGARNRLLPVAVALVIGLMDEAMQYYTPGRYADVADLIADLVGALIAMLVLGNLRNRRLRGVAT